MVAGHYFDTDPGVPSDRRKVRLSLPEGEVELVTDRGVFSGSRVDPGTLALLKTLPTRSPAYESLAGKDVLDLGCGYGPLALTVARRNPEAKVWALDVNARALSLTSHNASRLGLDNVRPVVAEDVPKEVSFHQIVSNPPVRVGKEVLHDLLRTWLSRLADDGEAWLVVQRYLGADSLAAWLADGAWHVERIASKKGYRVLRVAREASRHAEAGR